MPNGTRFRASRSPRGLAVLLLLVMDFGPLLAQVPSQAPQSALAGAAVFGSRGCAACHTPSPSGPSIGPDLRSATSSADVYGIVAALWNHLPLMAERMEATGIARPLLSTREAGDLVAFVYTLGASQGPGSVEAGRDAFRANGCIRCHRVADTGGVIGPPLDRIPSLRTPIGLAAGLWNHAGRMIPRMRSMGIPYPTLRAEEIADLAALLAASSSDAALSGDASHWVLPGDRERGRQVVEEKNCRSCHTIHGVGAGTAPDLATSGRRRTVEAFLAALWNKGPRMRAAFAARGDETPRFEPGEMADLVAYLQSLDYFVATGDARRGERIVGATGCLACHGWGEAGETADDLAVPLRQPGFAELVSVLWNHVAIERLADSEAVDWPTVSRAEMADILAYLGTGSP
ncbi:MAG: cytochrome c [Gemmatimonadota bacterium]|nr:cytochrome c [Gemmatimonadota bacterium]